MCCNRLPVDAVFQLFIRADELWIAMVASVEPSVLLVSDLPDVPDEVMLIGNDIDACFTRKQFAIAQGHR